MDNLSQALIIAAAVIIGAMLLGVYNNSMKNTEVYTGVYTKAMDEQELDRYNADFQSHVGIELTIYDVVSLMNRALYINEVSNFNSSYGNYVKVNIHFKTAPGISGIEKDNNDFIHKYVTGSTFNYREYQDSVYKLLNKYYDAYETVGGKKQVIDKKYRFELTVKTGPTGYVNELDFVQTK